MPIEQNLIMSPSITIAYSSIPEDPINGVIKISKIEPLKVSNTDIKNSCMFRDGSTENMKFQNMVLEYCRDKKIACASITEVPSITVLQEEIQKHMVFIEHQIESLSIMSWNEMFHNIVKNIH